jgi:DNA-binding helix-hairpin-helix protein with protein kinase domain
MTLRGLQGDIYTTENKSFASGGEGSIYKLLNKHNLLAKVYHPEFATEERHEKLKLMRRNPPNSETLAYLAWPVDILIHVNGSFAGFAMPALITDKTLDDIYLHNEVPEFHLKQRIILGVNICKVIEEVHKTGCVFGDFNPCNIGVNTKNGHAAFYDVDSFHVDNRRGNGKVYRAIACLPGYAAPEVLKTCRKCERDTGNSSDVYLRADLPTFTFWTDYFALAIHIFRLLFNGFNPYRGVSNAKNKSSKALATGDTAVENDQYCFKGSNKPASLLVPPLVSTTKEIGTLFRRAFIDGKDSPQKRPAPSEWESVLLDYRKTLAPCRDNGSHFYYRELSKCVWCEADARFKGKMPWPDNWPETFNKPKSLKDFFASINEL